MKNLGSALSLAVSIWCAGAAAQGKCDHYLDDFCVDAYGSASFDFAPLFTKPPRFAFGFRVFTKEEKPYTSAPYYYDGDINEVTAWLEYSNSTIHIDRSANRASDMALLITNATGKVSGGNNGCDGLLGKKCVTNLKDILKWTIVAAEEYPIVPFQRIEKFQATPLTNLSCPVGIFDTFYDLTGTKDFASEYDGPFSSIGKVAHPPPSGNASRPFFFDELTFRPAEEQLSYAGVGIAVRYPPTAPRAHDDVQVELVCIRPKPVKDSGDRIDPDAAVPTGTGDAGGDSDDSEEDAAGGLRVFSLLLGVAAAVPVVLAIL